jgi:ATP-binding cassette subfamily C (CFTR/MRP) protein 1
LWLEAIQARVDATAKMLGSMKGVKMLGMSEKLYNDIQGMKEVEIKKSQKFRELLIAAAAIGKIPHVAAF